MNKVACISPKQKLSAVIFGITLFLLNAANVSFAKDITLTWDANQESDVAFYNVHFKDVETQETWQEPGPAHDPSSNVATYQIFGLDETRQHCFTVTALNNSGVESPPSEEVCTTDDPESSTPISNVTMFTDVPADYWAKAAIDEFMTMGISNGCGNNQFCPDRVVTRAQMAVFLTKALEVSPAASCSESKFIDVDSDSVGPGFCQYIEAFSDLGITNGCGNGQFCPDRVVTRAQMAVFLTKALEVSPAASCSGSKFIDVDSDSVGPGFCQYIETSSDLGIINGCGNGQFCPDHAVTRAQMAVFMTRAF